MAFRCDGKSGANIAHRCGLEFALFVAVLCVSSCGYHIAGRASHLPSKWRTIAVPAFTNHTTHYRVEQKLTQAVVREFLARTSYHIVPTETDADAVLNGEVLSIETSPVLFDANTGQVTTMLVTMHSKVELVDRDTQSAVYKNEDMVFREEYQISGDVQSFFGEQDPAVERMSRDFASQVVAGILGGL